MNNRFDNVSNNVIIVQNISYIIIYYEVKYLIHCVMYKGIGIEFCWVPSHCGLYWNEISDKLAKQGAMKNRSEVSSNNLLLSSHEINSLLKNTVYKQIEKSKFAIPSCSRYLAGLT